MNSIQQLVLFTCSLLAVSLAAPNVGRASPYSPRSGSSGGGSHLYAPRMGSVVEEGNEQTAVAADVDASIVPGALTEQTRCSSTQLLNYIKDALMFYNGTDNALGISQRVSDNVLQNMDGPWIVFVTQMINIDHQKTQWAYWGSSTIYSSNSWCLYANSQWIVQIGKIAT